MDPVLAPGQVTGGVAQERISPADGGKVVHAANLDSSPTFKNYALAAISGVDLTTQRNGQGCCREIHVHGSGTLTLSPLSPISGDETLDVNDGEVLSVHATALVAASGITSVTVLW